MSCELIGIVSRHATHFQLSCVRRFSFFRIAFTTERATKWAPYLRERYFKLLADCTRMEAASLRQTPDCEYDACRKIIDYSGTVLAACVPATARRDAADRAMEYAKERALPITLLAY